VTEKEGWYAKSSAPVVETRQGALAGFTDDDVHVWSGIPYAAPPVGAWRWRSPQPPAAWEGLRSATMFSASSWQNSEYCQELGGGDPGQFSEDCLYLNVWSPVARTAPLPVMVWLHGGGFTIGAGGLPPYNGKALARRDVVVVTSIIALVIWVSSPIRRLPGKRNRWCTILPCWTRSPR
jgi:para-nitrobenzyl esterase